jgi:hypothetical protein
MMLAVSILEALDDPDLFAPLFRGDTWHRWRVFLAALFGLPLEGEALDLYRDHTGRLTAPAKPFREAALVIGRRGGKSRILALIAAFLACFRDYQSYLAPGEQPVVAIIADGHVQRRRRGVVAGGISRPVERGTRLIRFRRQPRRGADLRSMISVERAEMPALEEAGAVKLDGIVEFCRWWVRRLVVGNLLAAANTQCPTPICVRHFRRARRGDVRHSAASLALARGFLGWTNL